MLIEPEKNTLSWWRQGRTIVILAVVVTCAFCWFAYDAIMAPKWMRDFGLEIAARANVAPAGVQSSVLSTGESDLEFGNSYICLARLSKFSWDRVFIVPPGGEVPDVLATLDWGLEDLSGIKQRMARDDRYQLIAFVDGKRVTEHGYYYTMWADLGALANVQGFSRKDAVFLAESDGENYSLTPVEDGSVSACQ